MKIISGGDYLAPPIGEITALDIEQSLIEMEEMFADVPRISLGDLIRPDPHS